MAVGLFAPGGDEAHLSPIVRMLLSQGAVADSRTLLRAVACNRREAEQQLRDAGAVATDEAVSEAGREWRR